MLPTPDAAAGTRGSPRPPESRRKPSATGWAHSINLGDAVVALLPTPNPFHMNNSESPDAWMERRAEVEARTGTRHGPALSVVVESAVEGAPLYQRNGPRRWCGDRTNPPSAAGKT